MIQTLQQGAKERRAWSSLALSAFLFGALGACGSSQGGVRPERNQAALEVEGVTEGTRFYVNDQPAGRVTGDSVRLFVPAGEVRLRIEAPGMLRERLEFTLEAGQLYSVTLSPWPCVESIDPGCETAPARGE